MNPVEMDELLLARPMLALSEPVKAEHLTDAELAEGVYISPKLDGLRNRQYKCQSLSRTAKLHPNLYIQKTLGHPALDWLDGELIVGEPVGDFVYETTDSGVSRVQGEPDYTFWVFDTFENFALPFTVRYEIVRRKVARLRRQGFRVALVEQRLVYTREDVLAAEEYFLELGYEGAIIRKPSSPYKPNRSTRREGYLLKMKRSEDSTLRNLRFVEMTRNTNAAKLDERGYTKRSTHKANKVAAGTLGTIIGTDIHTGEEVTIGTGKMKAPEKARVWGLRDEWPADMLAEYRFFGRGKNGGLRHPRWIHWRRADDAGVTV